MERLWHRWPSTEAAASNGARLWWEREQRDNKLQESGSATARERGRGRERGTEGESLVADREEGRMRSWRSYCSSKGSSALADLSVSAKSSVDLQVESTLDSTCESVGLPHTVTRLSDESSRRRRVLK